MDINKPRIGWIDMAKGYGILFIIIGHFYIPIITPLLYTFHVPLFFFLSGYVVNMNIGFRSFFYHKIKKILFPYFFLSIPIIVSNIVFEYKDSFTINNLQTEISYFIIQKRHTTMWFLSSLFFLNVLLYPIVKKINADKQFLVVVSIAIIGLVLWRVGITVLPWNCDISFVALPFIFLGYKMRTKYKNTLITINKWYNAIFLIIATLLMGLANYVYTGSRIDLYYSKFTIEPLAYLNAFTGISAVIIFSQKTNIRFVRYLGQNSLLYFAWHQSIVFPVIGKVYQAINISQANFLPNEIWMFITSVLLVILTIFIITILNELIMRSKMSFILGK